MDLGAPHASIRLRPERQEANSRDDLASPIESPNKIARSPDAEYEGDK